MTLKNYCPAVNAGYLVDTNDLATGAVQAIDLAATSIAGTHITATAIVGSHIITFSTLLATITTTTPGTFAHSLGATPSFISVVARGTAAGTAPPYLSTADGTNIVIANSVAGATTVVDVYAIK